MEKLYDQFPELKPLEKQKDVQQSILQESDSLLHEKFEGFEYIFAKSFSEPMADTVMLLNIKNKSLLYESNPEMDNEHKTQEKTNIFEVSLEPSVNPANNINISKKKFYHQEKKRSFHLDLDKKKKKEKKKKEEFQKLN